MSEREFDQKVEEMAARLESRIEASADKLDRDVTRKYNDSRLFRFTTKGISVAAEIGLLIGGKHLAQKGYKAAAVLCVALGAVGLISELLQIFVFRRRK